MENQTNVVNNEVKNAVNNAVNNAVSNAVNNVVNNVAKKIVMDYVDQFAIHTKNTASSYLEMCKVVFDASKSLSQKDFELFCVTAHIGVAKAAKLKLIGQRYETLKQYVDTLPVNWTTLYKLTHLDDERIGELVADGKLYPEMPTKDLTQAAPELLEVKEKKKSDEKGSEDQPALQPSKELNALAIFENGLSDSDLNELRQTLEQLRSLGAKVEMSTALIARMETLEVVEMEDSAMEDSAMEDSAIEDETQGDEEGELEDESYEDILNERLAA